MTPSTSFDVLTPNWPAPKHVVAACSTRVKGVCDAPYAAGNLGLHVGDCERSVLANRQYFSHVLGVEKFSWLNQVHGVNAVLASEQLQTADAVYSREKAIACTVMTADCLPLLLCNQQGTEVAALHCGWRSLAGGIIATTLAKMASSPKQLMAWMGHAIGPKQFEVGQDVVEAFRRNRWFCSDCFTPISGGKYLADIYRLCRSALLEAGVASTYGGEYCTVSQEDLFFSFRRDGITGRMASAIAIT